MKASELIMAKALENDDFRLTKIAYELYESEDDFEMIKEANPMLKGFLAAGKELLKNNTVRNAAIGAGTGAVVGAANAPQGQGLKGALKGSLLGGVVGGGGTAMNNMYKSGLPLAQAAKSEGTALKNSFNTFSSQVKPLMKNLSNNKPNVPINPVAGSAQGHL